MRWWLGAAGVLLLSLLGMWTVVHDGPSSLGLVVKILNIVFTTALPLVLVVAFIACPFLGWRALNPTEETPRGRAFLRLFLAASLVVGAVWILTAMTTHRGLAFERAATRGDPIIAALAQYRADRDSYPETLSELVPNYITEIPGTSLMGYPEFEYRPVMLDVTPGPKSYELRIDCPIGLSFDRFIYWPAEVYPSKIGDDSVQQMGRWAMVRK